MFAFSVVSVVRFSVFLFVGVLLSMLFSHFQCVNCLCVFGVSVVCSFSVVSVVRVSVFLCVFVFDVNLFFAFFSGVE